MNHPTIEQIQASMFTPIGENTTTPSEQLAHFTNRVEEVSTFERILKIAHDQPIPLLMFYGVGGAGKSWMLKRLRQQTQIPTAYLDLDPRIGDQSWGKDSSRALAEIRRQFGSSIQCPRFDLAYAWLRYHEGRTDEPLFQGSGLLGNTWELIVEAGSAAADDIPGASIVTWVVNKVASPVKDWLSDFGVQDWLASKLGQEDFLTLKSELPSGIYPQLTKRLLEDLQKNLPENDGCNVKAVVFLDTIESLREDRSSLEKLDSAQGWLRDLYHPESGLLLVMGGRDSLQWGRVNPAFDHSTYLVQKMVSGLSKTDAVQFLENCDITDPAIQNAILAVSLDTETHSTGSANKSDGYHAYSLGLCADTCHNLLKRSETIDPESFDMSSTDTHALAVRFLRSMGGDGTYAEWLKTLSLTPRFDEPSARERFSKNAGAEQDAAWKALTSYSFFRETQQSGWFTLHARMREALAEIQQHDNPTLWQSHHVQWHEYWLGLSNNSIDSMASKAWYHTWCTEPNNADAQWKNLAEKTREELRMEDHLTLLDWWTPCEFDTSSGDEVSRDQHARALVSLGKELLHASLGDRAANIQRAIECYEAALRVRTEQAFPQDWAIIQNNLAIAYRNIPGGDRAANIQRAIECYEAALRVYTKQAFPREHKVVLNGLESARKLLK